MADVLIVGGGPCGLLAALLLTRQGVSCMVIEKHPGISFHPKAMGVSRRTAEIYKQLGLLERMQEQDFTGDYPWISLWSKSLVGEELGRVPMTERHSPFTPCIAFHCPQTWTEQVLLDALLQEPLAQIKFGCEMLHFEQSLEGVRIVVQDAEGAEAPFAGSWLIAADGAGSGIRTSLGIDAEGPGDMGHFLNVFFRASYGAHLADRRAILYQTLSEKGFEFFVTVNGEDLWLMHHFLEPGETPQDYSPEKLHGLIVEASGLPDVPVEVLAASPWVMSPKLASSFRSGRVLLVGDAAARLSPAGGLGLNTGMQSVHNLAWKLSSVLRGEAGEALLDSYQTERQAASFATMQNTNSNAEEIFEIVQHAMSGEWDAAKVLIAHSRRGGSGLGQDLGVTYDTGAFVPDGTEAPVVVDPVNDYQPDARPGARAPHVWIEIDGKQSSILDIFGEGFAILAARGGEYWTEAGVPAFVLGIDFESEDFEQVYGLKQGGAVLVRPDGYVGARFAMPTSHPSEAFFGALRKILATED